MPVAALAIALTPAAAGATPTVIRVGGPSAPGDAKVAIVASERNLGGRPFSVIRDGSVVLRGRLRPAPGSSRPWAHAYRANLSRVEQIGRYRVRAAGETSRPWRVVGANTRRGLFSKLQNFFNANRDGSERSRQHGPSHLNDAVIAGGPHAGERVDLTGGWMDAGDMIHFTQTTAFSALLLQAARRLDPAAPGGEALVGIRWLLKAHPFPDVFVTQVGGEIDHDQGFRDPARDDSSSVPAIRNRRAYHWGDGVGADIAGKVAAALAFAVPQIPPFRDPLINAATAWYEAGRASSRPSPVLPGTGGFYTFETWRGSMATGAAALHRVTGNPAYLSQALAYLRAADDERYAALEPATMAAFAAADICGVLGAPALGDGESQGFACRYLRDGAQTTLSYSRRNAFAPASYFQWGTTAVNAGLGAQAALAARAGFGRGRAIAAGARDWMFGRNPWGASFAAGIGPRSPREIHHWASVFRPHDGLPRGAVVGGPAPRSQVRDQGFRPRGRFRRFNSNIVYEDRRPNYVNSEPAIDYSVSAILLLAALSR